MHVMIIGAVGMLGKKLASVIAKTRQCNGQSVTRLTLVDIAVAETPENPAFPIESLAFDLSHTDTAPLLTKRRPDIIFHLAAIVSGEAENDFEKGYAINLDGTRHLFEAIRRERDRNGNAADYRPRVVFTSSIAVFGGPYPDTISDTFFRTPQTSYGTQKAIGELLLEDYTRRGFMDGVGLRLPTICIRPGLPNKAASGFFSSILREPLVGQPATLPVEDTVRHWHASPRAAVRFLLHAGTMDSSRLGHRRTLNMPGLSATVAEQVEALRTVAGNDAIALIRREPNPDIAAIIAAWPQDFTADRATDLGFRAERSFEDIIAVHIEDELGATSA
ncbi:SDR family oxidoreductase [Pelagibius litoralis]|uniref:SDR family oxidoreductase n=1 Tax=Pelagibius litoralis TaxID=374515 RepID=A0A967EVD7_9PROT|nr:D-erythronate dehydrogenase [Pelagibius litoralis]NIA68526.1 SDR family oxidoreductase [Pelagibius litoralis]